MRVEKVLNKLLLEQLLDELTEKERELIELRYFKDKTQAQVAEALSMSQVQVSRLEKGYCFLCGQNVHQFMNNLFIFGNGNTEGM